MARSFTSSGLVYQETVTSVRSMVPKWTTDSRVCILWRSVHASGISITWSPALCNGLDGGTQVAFISNSNQHRDTLTFHAWNIFRKAYPEEVDHHVTFRVQDRDLASMQYLSVVDCLSKLDVSMLTFLCVRTINLSIDHLIALTKISNLAILVLENGANSWHDTVQRPTVDMIRDWGRSVGESGSFTKLRALVLSGYDIAHINSVLKSISAFPALNLFGVDGLFIQSGVGCWGDWTNHLPKCTKASKLSPETIWETNTTTTASKMRQLYQFSLEVTQPEAAKMTACRSISMLYLQTRESVPRCHTEWFHRELQEGSDTKSKRAQDEEHRDRRETYGKKRKIRDRNKVGMESLLGGFM